MSEHKNFPPSAYISFSEIKDGETFTFRYGDREHRFTDHIYMCVDENYVGERIVIDLTVFDSFYIGDSESIDVRRVKYKIVAKDDEKEINMTSTKYEPPCKAGDTVYVIIKDKNAREVYPCKVVKVRIANKPDYSVLYLVHSDTFDFSLVVPFSDIGTTVFFSEAEALTARRKWLERK